jgi:hypothetical protein
MRSSYLSYLRHAFVFQEGGKKHQNQGSQEGPEEVDDGYDADVEDNGDNEDKGDESG